MTPKIIVGLPMEHTDDVDSSPPLVELRKLLVNTNEEDPQ